VEFFLQCVQRRYFKAFEEPGKNLKESSQYDNPIPNRFLAPTDCSKIPAQASSSVKGMEAPVAAGKTNEGLYIR
jgi:hypothetical protein